MRNYNTTRKKENKMFIDNGPQKTNITRQLKSVC